MVISINAPEHFVQLSDFQKNEVIERVEGTLKKEIARMELVKSLQKKEDTAKEMTEEQCDSLIDQIREDIQIG